MNNLKKNEFYKGLKSIEVWRFQLVVQLWGQAVAGQPPIPFHKRCTACARAQGRPLLPCACAHTTVCCLAISWCLSFPCRSPLSVEPRPRSAPQRPAPLHQSTLLVRNLELLKTFIVISDLLTVRLVRKEHIVIRKSGWCATSKNTRVGRWRQC